MNQEQERYFFLSGILSFVFFFFLVFSVIYHSFAENKILPAALSKSDEIIISIYEPTLKPVQKPIEPEPRSQPVEKEIQNVEEPIKSEQIQRVKPKSEPAISDLFSHVASTKPLPKVKPENINTQQLDALEEEVLKKNSSEKLSDKIKKIELVKPGIKMIVQGGSKGPLVNEYHAKIQGLIYTYFKPPSGTAKQSARVRLNFSAKGKLIGYKVISYSENGAFNNEVDWLKERLENVSFPPHPEGVESVIECILTAKEQ